MIKKIIYLFIILLLLVVLVYFSIQNNEMITVWVHTYRIDLTVGYLCIVTTIIGMLIAAIILLPYALIQRVQILALKSKNKSLTKKLEKEHAEVEEKAAIIDEQSENIDELEDEVAKKEKTGLLQGALLSSLNIVPKEKQEEKDEEEQSE